MERILSVTVRAPVASFRRPFDHNYQRTLLLPPPTTLLGIAGASLGLSAQELWANDSPLADVKVSVLTAVDEEFGRAKDMWTVMKIKAGRIEERSPYFRELLFNTRYILLYGGEETMLEKLRNAFNDPVYPLSLGREDELLLVEDIAIETISQGEPTFSGTIILGDFRQMEVDIRNLRPGIRFEPPVVETLPLKFDVDAKGIRHPKELKPFTFLPSQLEIKIKNPKLTVFQIKGKNFVWLNS